MIVQSGGELDPNFYIGVISLGLSIPAIIFAVAGAIWNHFLNPRLVIYPPADIGISRQIEWKNPSTGNWDPDQSFILTINLANAGAKNLIVTDMKLVVSTQKPSSLKERIFMKRSSGDEYELNYSYRLRPGEIEVSDSSKIEPQDNSYSSVDGNMPVGSPPHAWGQLC